MKQIIIAFFLSLLISQAVKAGNATPEVYGIKFNEIFLCEVESCSNGVKIGGGDRIDIADPYFTTNMGTLIDLKGANLGAGEYKFVKFNVDMSFLVKASSGSCYTAPNKVEAGFSDGTDDPKKYGEQLVKMSKDYIDCTECTNVTDESFDFTQPLSGDSYKFGTGKSIQWKIDVTNSIWFENKCRIGPDKPILDFQVKQF